MGDDASVRAIYKAIPGSKDVSNLISAGAFSGTRPKNTRRPR